MRCPSFKYSYRESFLFDVRDTHANAIPICLARVLTGKACVCLSDWINDVKRSSQPMVSIQLVTSAFKFSDLRSMHFVFDGWLFLIGCGLKDINYVNGLFSWLHPKGVFSLLKKLMRQSLLLQKKTQLKIHTFSQ
jgi:hypothetical protein